MKLASISQTKNQLSALIDQVRHGETVVITDRDRPVAKLVPIAAEEPETTSGSLALLERKGIIRRGRSEPCALAQPLQQRKNASALAILLDEREQGR
ncbi:MAG TPA: type II toxin-antitoxin system prevent-host-death family antitoxin [Candidatus Desulfobacillus sp.]|nr:type II toxin-antitoxin system prevent-host-death family antitoxin [Candidatus Desulfobacillus sp.]